MYSQAYKVSKASFTMLALVKILLYHKLKLTRFARSFTMKTMKLLLSTDLHLVCQELELPQLVDSIINMTS